jgi:hypothetical protein
VTGMIAILVGLVLMTGSSSHAAVAAAVPAAQTMKGEARCLSAQSLDDLFVVPPGFWENVGERDTLANYERRVFHHDDGRQVIEDVHEGLSPSDAIRRAAGPQAGLSSDPARSVAISVPCGTRTLLVVASGATYFSDEQMGPHPNAMLALETITSMIG